MRVSKVRFLPFLSKHCNFPTKLFLSSCSSLRKKTQHHKFVFFSLWHHFVFKHQSTCCWLSYISLHCNILHVFNTLQKINLGQNIVFTLFLGIFPSAFFKDNNWSFRLELTPLLFYQDFIHLFVSPLRNGEKVGKSENIW